MFNQDWCNVICNLNGAPVSEGPYFFVKPLDTLFQHSDGLKGIGALPNNTLLIDNYPNKNMRNSMWNAVHPISFHKINKPIGTTWLHHQLIPWLCQLRQLDQTVPKFCEANQGFIGGNCFLMTGRPLEFSIALDQGHRP